MSDIEGQKSEYELLREANIARNETFLKDLGIFEITKDLLIIDDSLNLSSESITRDNKRKRRTRPHITNTIEDDSGGICLRRSSRNRDDSLDDHSTSIKRHSPALTVREKYLILVDDDDVIRKKITAQQLREFIDSQSPRDSENISNQAIEHCVYRIWTMSNHALGNRINSISRGRGKKSEEKLLVFYYALQATGLHELAKSAQDALIKQFKINFDSPIPSSISTLAAIPETETDDLL